MRIFLTGGGGFLGHPLARQLMAAGHQLVALARSAEAATCLQGLGATVVRGDVQDTAAWAHVLDGIEVVIHAAAPVEFWGDWNVFENAIVNATINLYRAANHAGVPQFVFISSEAVLQGDRPLLDINEAEPYPAEPNSVYGRAKKMAEIRLRQTHLDTAITILRPSFIWGPGCPALQRICEAAQRRRFAWVDGGRAPFERVHVDNMVAAIGLAIREPRDGLYLVTDDVPGSLRDFLVPLFAQQGLPVPSLSLPAPALRPLTRGMEMLWQGLNIRRPPPLTRFELAFLSQPRRYDISHIRRELGYAPVTSTATGLARLEASFVP